MISSEFELTISTVEWLRANILGCTAMGISHYFIVCLICYVDAERLNLMEEVTMLLNVIKQCNYLKVK